MNFIISCFLATLLLAASPAGAVELPVQQEEHFETGTPRPAKIDYLLFLPAGYEKSKEDFPLILFLHGASESGTELAQVKHNGPPKYVESHPEFPFILVSPQTTGGWDGPALEALLEQVRHKYRVDPYRVYLTGLSMGGNATWALAAAHPKKFAAVVPVSGWADPKDAKTLAALPIWVFHGEKDTIMSVEFSRKMVEAIRKFGGNVKYTEFPGAHHNIWKKTYDNPEIYQWLLAQKRP